MTPKQLGEKLHHWHSGTDAIYAAGSTLFAGRGVTPEIAKKAIELLKVMLPKAKAGMHGWGPADARELSSLIKALGAYTGENTAAKGPKFVLTRIHLDRGGYAKGSGRYYGVGAQLFSVEDEGGKFVEEFRAADREAAKAKVRQRFPGARF